MISQVLDNCGSHTTAEVATEAVEAGWELKFLPKNCTDMLQPMDLVVNAVVKAALRRKRVALMLQYFQEFKAAYIAATRNVFNIIEGKRRHVKFEPPTLKIGEGIVAMFDVVNHTLKEEKFRRALKSTFHKVGLVQGDDDGAFRSVDTLMSLDVSQKQTVVWEKDGSIKIIKPERHHSESFTLNSRLLIFAEREDDGVDTDLDNETEEGLDSDGPGLLTLTGTVFCFQKLVCF